MQGKAELRALAKKMLRGSVRSDMLDGAYHRYAFHDTHMPRWFEEDESRHMKCDPVCMLVVLDSIAISAPCHSGQLWEEMEMEVQMQGAHSLHAHPGSFTDKPIRPCCFHAVWGHMQHLMLQS